VLLYADVVEADEDVAGLIQDVNFRVMLVTRKEGIAIPEGWTELCSIIRVPHVPQTRSGQIKVALLVAAAEGLVRPSERLVCMTGIGGSGTIDTIIVIEPGTELELFTGVSADPIPTDVQPAVFERLLSISTELGIEGREGRPVGALFVVGDHERVEAMSRQLVINPFKGYPEAERNVLDPALEETLKEFSAIDGAFIVRGDGVVLAAGRYLTPVGRSEIPITRGLGTRHEAAVGMTVSADCLAFCISQSTGTVLLAGASSTFFSVAGCFSASGVSSSTPCCSSRLPKIWSKLGKPYLRMMGPLMLTLQLFDDAVD
jgi:DNA integrity scanning protein DisA with diadenylate cyclase activity